MNPSLGSGTGSAMLLHRRSPQIVSVGALNLHCRDVAGAQRPAARDVDGAVDLRGVALAAAFRLTCAALVDDDLEAVADFRGEFLCADRLRALHEAPMSARLDFIRHGREAEIVRRRALDRLVLEGADAVEFCFVEPVDEETKVLLRL